MTANEMVRNVYKGENLDKCEEFLSEYFKASVAEKIPSHLAEIARYDAIYEAQKKCYEEDEEAKSDDEIEEEDDEECKDEVCDEEDEEVADDEVEEDDEEAADDEEVEEDDEEANDDEEVKEAWVNAFGGYNSDRFI